MFNVLCGHGCVESQHHVFLVAALWVQLPHVSAGVVSLYVCVCMHVRVYFVVLRGGPVGIQSDVWCSEGRKRDDGSQREGETGTEYWLSLCLTWSVSVFVSEIWWPHQLSETRLSERVCFCVGVCVWGCLCEKARAMTVERWCPAILLQKCIYFQSLSFVWCLLQYCQTILTF